MQLLSSVYLLNLNDSFVVGSQVGTQKLGCLSVQHLYSYLVQLSETLSASERKRKK